MEMTHLEEAIEKLYRYKLKKYNLDEMSDEEKKYMFATLYIEAVTEIYAGEMTLRNASRIRKVI